MSIRRSEIRTWAFELSAEDIEKLDKSFRNFGVTPKFEIDCSDNYTRKYGTLAELIDFENSPGKAIRKLNISGRVWTREEGIDRYASIWFTGHPFNNVWISIEGDDEGPVTKIAQDIEDRLSAMKPWYSLITRFDYSWIFVLGLSGVWFGAVLIAKGNEPLDFQVTHPLTGWEYIWIFGIAMLPSILGVILNFTTTRWFPRGVFAIGQGAKRHKDKEIIRINIIVAFVISIAASFALLFFTLP